MPKTLIVCLQAWMLSTITAALSGLLVFSYIEAFNGSGTFFYEIRGFLVLLVFGALFIPIACIGTGIASAAALILIWLPLWTTRYKHKIFSRLPVAILLGAMLGLLFWHLVAITGLRGDLGVRADSSGPAQYVGAVFGFISMFIIGVLNSEQNRSSDSLQPTASTLG
ncbi:MAG: hypothetical protein AAFY98_04865 [Verrucomicrobiota bacterium]